MATMENELSCVVDVLNQRWSGSGFHV